MMLKIISYKRAPKYSEFVRNLELRKVMFYENFNIEFYNF